MMAIRLKTFCFVYLLPEASFYQGGEDFTCLDGSHTIAFGKVNDDYCDCTDGSDEPGKLWNM